MRNFFKSIGYVAIDGERLKLTGNIPEKDGVYAFFFDGRLKYIGAAKRENGKGLHARIRRYLRGLSYVKGGTTSEMRVRIRDHIISGGSVEIRVVVDCRVELFGKKTSNDPLLFERAAINLLRPEWNRT